MTALQFISPDTPVHAAHGGQYSPALVALSVLIAVFAAYASFSHVDLIRTARSRLISLVWLCSGAVAMGVGVWTMHFTGMVAFRMPVEIHYDLNLTLTSVLPAILAGLVTLSIIHRPNPEAWRIGLGGVLMGSGIGTMHYTGMGAMITTSDILYHPWLFAGSIVTAVVLATFALAIPRLLGRVLADPVLLKLISALLMGLAVSGMHYVAMSATVFLPGAHEPVAQGTVMDQTLLASLAVLASLIILVSSTLVALMRNRLLWAELERERSEASSQHLEQRFQKIVSRLPGMVYQFRQQPDGSLSFPYASEAIRDIYGVTPEEVQQDAMRLTEVIHPDDLEAVLTSIGKSAAELGVWQQEYRVRRPDGSERWLQGNALPEREEDGSILWNGFIMDVTERRESDDIIHRLAFYDALTGLPNRRLLLDRLHQARTASARDHRPGALMFIDLDDFKSLNDTLGHSVGDHLLRLLAGRLQDCLRAHDTVARLGGDEFVIVLSDLDSDEHQAAIEAELIAEQVLAEMTRPADLQSTAYQCSASIGISLFHGKKESVEELLRRADVAMYQAKSSGRNGIRFFDPTLHSVMEARFKLENELNAAVDDDQLELFYQVQVDREGGPCGAEALLRWRHPQRGLLGPGEFIPLAEETGLIVAVGHWVLQAACAQLAVWAQEEDFQDLSLAINISARQFHQPDFVHTVLAATREFGISPQCLKLELTESLVLNDLKESVSRMHELRQHGVQFAMDDFGTGYSSLAYLSRLPFDEVKIDQSFVRHADLQKNSPDSTIVTAIISLTHSLDMQAVAEGVETAAHREFLLQQNCDTFQGFLFNRPQSISDFEQLLRDWPANGASNAPRRSAQPSRTQ